MTELEMVEKKVVGGNGGNGGGGVETSESLVTPARGRAMTRADLMSALQVAREAAHSAAVAGEAAAAVADQALSALSAEAERLAPRDVVAGRPRREATEPPPVSVAAKVRGTRDMKRPEGVRAGTRPPPVDRPPTAIEALLSELGPKIREIRGRGVGVEENVAWIKFESHTNGHRLYVARTVRGITRVHSTMPVALLPGSKNPSRRNGRIASEIPPTLPALLRALDVLADPETPRL